MNEKARKHRDFIQNITIAVLTVSAVLLFAQTQIANLGASSTFSRFFSGPDTHASPVITAQSGEALSAPVRIAVTSSYGRYGDISLTTGEADESYEPLRRLLEQALGSAQAFTASNQQAFLEALNHISVYYDFLSSLPMSVLASLNQTEFSDDTVSARHLVLAEENEAVFLYLWDDASRYLRCATALSPEDLVEVVSQYELGNAFFAFENEEAHTAAPCSLFLEDEPALPTLSASAPLSDTTLLASLHFNPNTQNRYWESDGTEVISETGGRTLRIETSGLVSYQGGNDPTLSIEAAGEFPTFVEAASEVGALLNSLLSAGDARVYLESIQQVGSSTTLSFGYQADGVPIRFADGQSAAQVTISGTTVTSMTLRFRQYTVREAESLLLPLRQALAIAASQANTELSIGYADSGSDIVSAAWLAD